MRFWSGSHCSNAWPGLMIQTHALRCSAQQQPPYQGYCRHSTTSPPAATHHHLGQGRSKASP